VARAIFRRGNPYLTLRDELGPIFRDTDFLSLYGHAGHPATSPALLALVTALQYMEHLTDDQAAEAVRSRVDWKYLLGLALEDEGFDASVLSEFRTRLVDHGREEVLLDQLLEELRERDLLRPGGRQRTDSTRVLMAVRALHQVELVGETMRQALNTLAIEAPDWIRAHSDPAWPARYGPRLAAARLPQATAARQRLAQQIGRDGVTLLAALDAPGTSPWLGDLAAIRTLRQVWAQQYEQRKNGPRLRAGVELPPASDLVRTPYDPEARWSVRRETAWTGYTVHLTEACEPDRPGLLTSVETTVATTPDAGAIEAIQAHLADRKLLPTEHLLDAGYIRAPLLVRSQQTYGITVLGPLQPDSSWQGRAGAGFAAGDFSLDWDHAVATCPQGKRSSTWRPVTGGGGQPAIQIHFRRADCGVCPLKVQCTRADRRSLTIQPRPVQEAIRQARTRQACPTVRATYAVRAGVEGTISQAVRRTGIRVARYRGLAKTHLQHVCTAVALNLIRLAAWYQGTDRVTTRQSPYARIMAAA
jgi:transposase